MKIVINKCYGGFGLSHEGVLEFARRKGLKVYPEKVYEALGGIYTYWLIPKEDRRLLEEKQKRFYELPLEERKAFNNEYGSSAFSDFYIARDDPVLVAMVEEGDQNWVGQHASLKVVTIPDDVTWQIEEYDGMEWVAEVHRTWG